MKVASRPENPEVWVKKQLTDIPVIRLFFRIPFLSDFRIIWISVFPILQFSDVSNFQISEILNFLSDLPTYLTTSLPQKKVLLFFWNLAHFKFTINECAEFSSFGETTFWWEWNSISSLRFGKFFTKDFHVKKKKKIHGNSL